MLKRNKTETYSFGKQFRVASYDCCDGIKTRIEMIDVERCLFKTTVVAEQQQSLLNNDSHCLTMITIA